MGHTSGKSSDGNDHNADGHRHPGRDATPHYQGVGVELTQSGRNQADKEPTKTGESSPLVTTAELVLDPFSLASDDDPVDRRVSDILPS